MTQRQQPFRRINAAYHNLAVAEQFGNKELISAAKAQLFNYRSRGKGKGLHQKSNIHAHMMAVRKARTAHNKAKRK